jgi:uncharacterized protein (DUF885 family)
LDLRALRAAIVNRVAAIDASIWDKEDATTLAVIEQQARNRMELIDSRWLEFTITSLFASPAAQLLSVLPLIAVSDTDRARAYVERLNAIPSYLSAAAERHRIGVVAGRVPVARLVQAAIDQLDRYLADPAADPLVRQPFPPDAKGLAAERDVLAGEILEHGRPDERPGACHLPDGDTIYQRLSKVHLTIDRDPEELHQIGLDVAASPPMSMPRLSSG